MNMQVQKIAGLLAEAVEAAIEIVTKKADAKGRGKSLIETVRTVGIELGATDKDEAAKFATLFKADAVKGGVPLNTARVYANYIEGYAELTRQGVDVTTGGGRKLNQPLPKEAAAAAYTALTETDAEKEERLKAEAIAEKIKAIMVKVKGWSGDAEMLQAIYDGIETPPVDDSVNTKAETKAERETRELLEAAEAIRNGGEAKNEAAEEIAAEAVQNEARQA